MKACGAIEATRLQRVFACLSVLAFGVALFDLFTEGVSLSVGPIRLSTREPFRPLIVGVLSETIAIWLWGRTSASAMNWDRTRRWPPRLAAAVVMVTIAMGIHFGDFAAGGADAYGYVSQASLWAAGHVVVPEPLTTLTPPLGESVAPLGYKLARTPGAIVPVYSPGLPMVMAVALRLAGTSAVSLVVPLLGGLAVWLTYVLGARVAGPITGLVAAGLTACSPIFLAQLTQPMSDVPVTAWWLAALALALGESRWMALFAGCASSAALLTRPNLLPLVLIVALLVFRARPRVRRGLLFAVGLVPGCVAVAVINQTLYGSPFTSGYGSVDALFKWSRLGANLGRYPLWLLQSQSAFIYLALVAPLAGLRPADPRTPDFGIRNGTIGWLLLAFCAVLLLCYLFFIPFDEWRFLRFLLPAVPPLLILSSAVGIRLMATLPRTRKAATAFAFCGLLACWYLKKAADLGILTAPGGQDRYVVVGEYVKRVLPQNAVLITVLDSGSVRVYGHRSTVRWDLLPGGDFDHAVAVLQANGYAPYLLLEDWEEPEFRKRFEKTSMLGRLDRLPAVEYAHDHVRVWALGERERIGAGIRTTHESGPPATGAGRPAG